MFFISSFFSPRQKNFLARNHANDDPTWIYLEIRKTFQNARDFGAFFVRQRLRAPTGQLLVPAGAYGGPREKNGLGENKIKLVEPKNMHSYSKYTKYSTHTLNTVTYSIISNIQYSIGSIQCTYGPFSFFSIIFKLFSSYFRFSMHN